MRVRISKSFVVVLVCYFLAAAVAADSVLEAENTEVIERGESILNKCLVCHTVSKGDAHAAGPNLFGLMNRPVGKVAGYKFSRALRKSNALWTPELLGKFLTAPADVFPRNRMAFAGLKNESDREALLQLLATLKD